MYDEERFASEMSRSSSALDTSRPPSREMTVPAAMSAEANRPLLAMGDAATTTSGASQQSSSGTALGDGDPFTAPSR